MTDLVALQEAEGRVKGARDAYHAAVAEFDRVSALHDGLVATALAKLTTAEGELRTLLAAARKVLDEREARAFDSRPPPVFTSIDEPKAVFWGSTPPEPEPLRPVDGLVVVPNGLDPASDQPGSAA